MDASRKQQEALGLAVLPRWTFLEKCSRKWPSQAVGTGKDWRSYGRWVCVSPASPVTERSKILRSRWVTPFLGRGFKHFLFYPYLGKWSSLTIIFFRWVETTNKFWMMKFSTPKATSNGETRKATNLWQKKWWLVGLHFQGLRGWGLGSRWCGSLVAGYLQVTTGTKGSQESKPRGPDGS